MAKPRMSLKADGVPFGARWVFRLQYAGFLLMCVLLVLTLPFALLWGLVHESGAAFIEGVNDVLQERAEQVKQHRVRLVAMYAPKEQ